MPTDKAPPILVCESCDAVPLQWLSERARIFQIRQDAPGFNEALHHARGLLVRTYTRVNDDLLDNAPELKVVGRGGVGLENIDVGACRRRGIQVVYTPDANTLAVGDFVFGYLLQLLRPWAPFSQSAYSPAEFKHIRDTVRGRQLNELTLGILGMGRVGRRVGHIGALGFSMRVIYHDLQDVKQYLDFPAEAVAPPQLFHQADILSIHVDMRPGNENLVGAAELYRLPAGAVVINTSRGEVLDATALADAIRSGHLAGAALDVYSPEPPGDNFPLLRLPNVLLTPHLAARTSTAMENMSWVVRDVWAVLQNQAPRYPAP